MSDLLKKPFGKRGKVHQVTPESAGWRYVGFSLYHLKAGDKAAEATGDPHFGSVALVPSALWSQRRSTAQRVATVRGTSVRTPRDT